jgi:hypothetical protein
MFLCRNGRVKFYDADQMRMLLKIGYEAAAPSDQAKSSPPNDLYPKIASYFDTHETGVDGFRWRLSAEYDSDQSAGKTYLQLRASMVWTKPDMGDSLDRIEQKTSGYQAILQNISPTTNYLWFLVWPDSFAEHEVARDVANDYGFSAGWAPQVGGEMDFLMARATITTQSPLEVPALARQTQHHYIPTTPMITAISKSV